MFFARCSAAAVEPVRSMAPEVTPLAPTLAADTLPAGWKAGSAPSPAKGWLSGMAGTYSGAHLNAAQCLESGAHCIGINGPATGPATASAAAGLQEAALM